MAKQILNYRPIKENGIYDIWVTELFDRGNYRVELFESYSPHTTQIVDLRLNYARDRRWLEDYVSSLLEDIRIKGVWFGTGRSMNNNHYTLDTYIERNPWTAKFLNDLHINLNK